MVQSYGRRVTGIALGLLAGFALERPAAAAPICPTKPSTACLTSEKASFQIRNDSDNARDQLKWSWSKGAAVGQSQLGDPSATTAYALCIYDSTAGTNSFVGGLQIDPNTNWDDKSPKGWSYKDSLGSEDGTQSAQLKTGATGKTKARMKAGGALTLLPGPVNSDYFDLDPRLTVQLVNDEPTPTCWSSVFTTASKNTPEEFKARSSAPPATSTTTTTMGPVCGNAIIEPGEDCESDTDCAVGEVCALTCQCVPGGGCPEWIELTMHAGAGTMSTATEYDLGWRGSDHDVDLADEVRIALEISGTSGSGPATCGEATIGGLDPREGNCRCNHDNRLTCHSTFALDATDCDIPVACTTNADCRRCNVTTTVACGAHDDCPSGEHCMNGPYHPTCSAGQCVGNCECYMAPPQPQHLSGGTPYCVVRKLRNDVTGTWNLDAGSYALQIDRRDVYYLGEANSAPCPPCVGDVTPNDGIRGGVCVEGDDDGASCDANSLDATYPGGGGGAYSYDCLPNSGKNVSGAGQWVDILLTTGTQSMTAGVACGFPPFLPPEICPCGVCSGDKYLPCASDADCTGMGTCGLFALGQPRANDCSDGICNAVSGDEGECNAGPDGMFCDGFVLANGRPLVTCSTNADCDAQDCDASTPMIPDGCGSCTIVKRRECFRDPIGATGAASTTDPVGIGVACLQPTAKNSLNLIAGIPGPARVTMASSAVPRCPGGAAYPPCP